MRAEKDLNALTLTQRAPDHQYKNKLRLRKKLEKF